MNSREYFVLGSKLIGVWCFFMSILSLGAAITTFADGPKMGDEYASMMFLTRVAMRIIPVIYISVGIYLLKNGTVLHNLAYPDENKTVPEFDLVERFVLFLKLIGVYLIVSYFPDLLKSISNFLTFSSSSAAYNLFAKKQFAYVNFLPSLSGILIGFYLLKSGQFFIGIAFKSGINNKEQQAEKEKRTLL